MNSEGTTNSRNTRNYQFEGDNNNEQFM